MLRVCTIKAYLQIGLRKNGFIDSLKEHFKKVMKMLDASIFSFIILNLVKKGILEVHIPTTTNKCIKEVFDSSLEDHFEEIKALILSIIATESAKIFLFTIMSYL